ncbi:hypothetical protein BDN70DRAFT_840292 [Pholiota conissans]|uniref:Uncharacterized protein n=1 Tax=Pholiota conissans TaxID=109636 RepID=A0A9P5YXK8_9AGAR|nr:hypothetical protein BDN70DRAFT_840292 [Pholiota conissans]
MPILTPEAVPPLPKTFGGAYNGQDRPPTAKATSTPVLVEKLIKELPRSHPKLEQPPIENGPKNAYPVVKLDVDTISEAVAGRLATSLLGHVLFLKNQVPFPVMQLGRLPGGKVNSRAFKQRTELLSSYDTISSHLDTTFSALSTALARCANAKTGNTTSTNKVAQAHVAILVGPSLGAAKSKVILGIDGLEARVWGVRDDSKVRGKENAALEDNSNESEDEEEEEEEEEEENHEESDEERGDDDLEGSNGAEEPEESEDEDEEDEANEDEEEESADDNPTLSPPLPPYISYAEEQRFLQNAERLLSRTLAAADAEGNGIASEMTPTQTHILIRAPRRFNHPAWIPRQNVTNALDASLQDFMYNSGFVNAATALSTKQSSKKGKVEGVWVTSRGGIQERPTADLAPVEAGQDDADEMIWWSWDGKFVGFNDW